MSSQSRFSDPAYIAWLRDTLALLYLKEGIEDITNAVATKFHDDLKLALGGSACTSCSPRDMIKDFRGQRWYMNCPVCDPWLQQIIRNHRIQPLPNIHHDNTNPQLWPTDPWEVLKCYMGYGCQGIHSAKDADTQNLLTLFKNCLQFATCCQIGRMDLVDGLLEIRNSLFHSGDFRVDEPQLQRDIQTMLDFLAGVTPTSPVESQAVTEAVNKITELKNDSIDLSLASNKDLELRALQEKQKTLDLKQRKLQKKLQSVEKTAKTGLKTLQTDLSSLKRKQTGNTCKINTAKGIVKKLRADFGAIEAKMNTNEGAVETLRTDLGTIEAQANTTEGAVETLRIDLGTIEAKTNTTEGAVETLRTDLGTIEAQANTTEGAVETLRTDLRTIEAKTNTTEGAVETLRTDLGTIEAKTNTTEGAVKTLRTDLGALEAKANTTEGVVNTLRTDLGTIEAKANTTEGAVKTLRTDLGALEAKANTTESVVQTLQTDLGSLKRNQADNKTDLESQIQKVQSDQDQFKKFLQANSLDQDLSRLSTHIEQHERRIQSLEQQSQRSQQGSCEVAEDDIAGLQSELVKHYRGGQSLLVPNPVVDEALDLDEIYVRPDIKVLRETSNPRAGLKTVQTNTTAGSGSMCKNLFYTDQYQNKQIYVAGNAGVGKTVLCKYLVNLWCQIQSDPQSGSATSKPTVETSSPMRQEQEQNQEASHFMEPDASLGSLHPGSSTASAQTMLQELLYEYSPEAKSKKWAKKTKLEEEADRKIMAEFHLLFYISLRDSTKHYTIADMIDAQILQQIRGLSHLKAADILQNSRCLVIIDGLDEWACPEDADIPPFINPGIPGRDINSNSVFLTTTRPWKLDVLRLKGLEIDKHVELCGLNEASSEELCSKYIDFVNKLDGTNKKSQSFSAELKKKGLERFHNVPNLLILLIGLWIDDQDLGQSRLQLFCSMLEMLLKRAAEKNLPQQRSNDSVTTKSLLPECFNNRPHCLIHQHLLALLCKAAFEFLLEDALVFNASQLTIFGINPDGIDLCLKSGILTQDKVLGKRSATKKKISFLHKQLQEVLAAVYISNRENTEQVTSRVYDFCTTVESVLELSQVWMFVSGIRPDLARELLTELMTRVVLNDDRLHQNRSTIKTFDSNTALPRSIQTCIVDCVMEARSNGHGDLPLPLHDFVIDRDTISACLEYLVTTNTSVIKSVYIYIGSITGDKVQTVEGIVTQLQQTSCLQALYLEDVGHVVSDMSPLHKALVNNKDTLTCLVLDNITLSPELHAAVCGSLHHLTSLKLWAVSLTHKQVEQFLSSVSQAGSMRELELWLHCTDHGGQCRPGIDLSGLTQLHTLHLYYMPVAQLPAVAPSVEFVYLGGVTVAESQLRQFIHQLSSTSHSVKVQLGLVTVTGENENPVDLTDLRNNSKLHVTRCYNNSDNTWIIHFSTLQQTTSESGN